MEFIACSTVYGDSRFSGFMTFMASKTLILTSMFRCLGPCSSVTYTYIHIVERKKWWIDPIETFTDSHTGHHTYLDVQLFEFLSFFYLHSLRYTFRKEKIETNWLNWSVYWLSYWKSYLLRCSFVRVLFLLLHIITYMFRKERIKMYWLYWNNY